MTQNDEAERLIAALSSQIGDDVSVIFNHESLFKRSRDLIRTQAARIAELEGLVAADFDMLDSTWKARAEAEARTAALVAAAYEDVAKVAERFTECCQSCAGIGLVIRQHAAIRALAQKEATAVFPPPRCTAWEDCKHDGICHDFKYCEAIGPSHEAFYGEAEE